MVTLRLHWPPTTTIACGGPAWRAARWQPAGDADAAGALADEDDGPPADEFEDEDEEILAATPMYGTTPKVRNRSDRAAGPDSSLAMA